MLRLFPITEALSRLNERKIPVGSSPVDTIHPDYATRRKDREKTGSLLIFEVDGITLISVYKEVSIRKLLQDILDEIRTSTHESISTSEIQLDLVPSQPLIQAPAESLPRYVSQPSHDFTGYQHNRSLKTSTVRAVKLSSDKSDSSVLDLRIRDLRRLDFAINPNEDLTIQVRRNVVLFSADPIRAIVTTSKLRVVVPAGADQLMRILEDFISATRLTTRVPRDVGPINDELHSGHTDTVASFEIDSYECILSTVRDIMALEFDILKKKSAKILAYINRATNVNLIVQDKLREIKDELERVCAKVKKYRNSLHNIIEDDEKMALMNITYLADDSSLYRYPLAPSVWRRHEEIEEALEIYLSDFTSFESDLDLVRSMLLGAESQTAIRLDYSQNQILMGMVVLNIVLLNVVFCAYIAGIFGMNLDNTISMQPVKGVFPTVLTGTFVLMILGSMTVYYYLVYMGVIQDDTRAAKILFRSLQNR